jgi:hypothetical protein
MATIGEAKKFLVLEDSTSDRLRFRLLLEPFRQERVSVDFAWRLASGGQGSVMAWLLDAAEGDRTEPPGCTSGKTPGTEVTRLLSERTHSVIPKLCTYDFLLLDLAWSVTAERTVIPLILESFGVLLRKQAELESNVEGLALLSGLNDRRDEGVHDLPEVWVTSAYVPRQEIGFPLILTADYGVSPDRIFHKWSDERLFLQALREAL